DATKRVPSVVFLMRVRPFCVCMCICVYVYMCVCVYVCMCVCVCVCYIWVCRRCTAWAYSPDEECVWVADKSGDVYSFSTTHTHTPGDLRLGNLQILSAAGLSHTTR